MLPLADRLLYAFGSVGNATLFWALGLWLVFFYSADRPGAPALLPLAVVGVARGLGQMIETLDDPIIGWWSDRTRSRWGRRIPFILFGTPLLALSFWLLWVPPADAGIVLIALFFFVVLEVHFFANTVVGAPYEALQAEIATTSPDRVSLGAWKVFFGTIGLVLALVVSPTLIEAFGFSGMGVVLAVIAGLSLYAMLFGLWRRGTLSRPAVQQAEQIGLRQSIRVSLSHSPFRALALSFVLFSIAYNGLILLMPFYVTVIHGRSEGEVRNFLGGVIATVVVALPFMAWGARRFGKRAVYAASMLAISGYLVFLGVGAFRPVIPGIDLAAQSTVLIALSGLGFAALFVFPGAMMADVVDDDTARSGRRRAAIYYGMFKTLEKLAQGAGTLLFTLLLSVFGYTAERSLGIQLALPVAGVCALAGFAVIATAYRLREAPAVAPA